MYINRLPLNLYNVLKFKFTAVVLFIINEKSAKIRILYFADLSAVHGNVYTIHLPGAVKKNA